MGVTLQKKRWIVIEELLVTYPLMLHSVLKIILKITEPRDIEYLCP